MFLLWEAVVSRAYSEHFGHGFGMKTATKYRTHCILYHGTNRLSVLWYSMGSVYSSNVHVYIKAVLFGLLWKLPSGAMQMMVLSSSRNWPTLMHVLKIWTCSAVIVKNRLYKYYKCCTWDGRYIFLPPLHFKTQVQGVNKVRQKLESIVLNVSNRNGAQWFV